MTITKSLQFILQDGINPDRLNVLKVSDREMLMSIYMKNVGKVTGILANCNQDTYTGQISGEVTDISGKNIQGIQWAKVGIDESISEDEVMPVVLQSEDGTIYYIANMNRQAMENSMNDRQLWVYSKTNKQLQKKGATSGDFINVVSRSFEVGMTHGGDKIARLIVKPTTESVCHEKDPETGKGYETCFFRNEVFSDFYNV